MEWGITEAQALQICYDRGYDWGGLYEIYNRASCWCCPLQRIGELKKLRCHHPELWARLLDMDNRARAMFLSFPEDWNYSTRGLAAICKEGVDAIGSTIKELEKAGYIIRRLLRGANERITDTEYIIYEKPQPPEPPAPDADEPDMHPPDTASPHTENPDVAGPDMAAPHMENPAELNINQFKIKNQILSDQILIHSLPLPRRRKDRSAPFPPAAKTALAPLLLLSQPQPLTLGCGWEPAPRSRWKE